VKRSRGKGYEGKGVQVAGVQGRTCANSYNVGRAGATDKNKTPKNWDGTTEKQNRGQ